MYYSGEGQDKFLNENYFKNKKNGFFVDVGAHRGIWISNTYFFENELGWDGICIEPSPTNLVELLTNRKCKCINVALSDEEEIVDFYVHEDRKIYIDGSIDGIIKNYTKNAQGEIKEELKYSNHDIIRIKTFTFNSIVGACGVNHIDFVSIDTEGSEIAILKGIDFDRFQIDFMVMAQHYRNDDPEQNIDYILNDKGFDIVYSVGNDFVFKNRKI